MSILYTITKHLINVLEARGEDTSALVKKRGVSQEIDDLRLKLLQTQGALGMARAEIIQAQAQLLSSIESPFFHIISTKGDSWEKTTITKVWMDNYHEIQGKIRKHQDCTNAFEEAYRKLESAQQSVGK